MTRPPHPVFWLTSLVLFLIMGTVAAIHWWYWLIQPLNFTPLLLSFGTLASMWLTGTEPRRGWQLSLAFQALWFAYTFLAGAWGFLPLNIGLTFVYYRNWRKTFIKLSDEEELKAMAEVMERLFTRRPDYRNLLEKGLREKWGIPE